MVLLVHFAIQWDVGVAAGTWRRRDGKLGKIAHRAQVHFITEIQLGIVHAVVAIVMPCAVLQVLQTAAARIPPPTPATREQKQ